MPNLRVEELYQPHQSLRRNRRIDETVYYTYAVERWGTGDTRMVEACRSANLPLPEFAEQSRGFLVVLRRELLTETLLVQTGLNPRQVSALMAVGIGVTLTTIEYRRLAGASKTTADRDIKAFE